MGSVAVHEKKGVVRMTEIERRLKRLEQDIKRAKEQQKAEERAKEIEAAYPKTEQVQKTLYEVRCGNCGVLWQISETALLAHDFTSWRYCPNCGVKIKGVE